MFILPQWAKECLLFGSLKQQTVVSKLLLFNVVTCLQSLYSTSSLFITLSLLIAGCSQANHEQVVEKESANTGMTQVAAKQEQVWQSVTVKYLDFEGGFFGLVAKGGEKLLPMNLAKKYQVDGSTLKVRGHIIEGMMTIQQWGTAFEVTDVELIKLGKAHEKNKGNEY